MMTPVYFLDDLKSELENIFKNSPIKDEEISIFKQSLPIPESEEDPEPFPYIIIRIRDGELSDYDEGEIISAMLIFGSCNKGLNNEGYYDVLNLINRVKQHFLKHQILKDKYPLIIDNQHPINWTIQDEDTYPYFFGGLQMHFRIITVVEEDSLI